MVTDTAKDNTGRDKDMKIRESKLNTDITLKEMDMETMLSAIDD